MKIIVCIKQVPDTTSVKMNPETNTLIRDGVVSIINPFDTYATGSFVLRRRYPPSSNLSTIIVPSSSICSIFLTFVI